MEKKLPEIKSVDEDIEELVGIIRDAREAIAEVHDEYEPVIDVAKDRLMMLLAYRGESWSDDDGYARLVSEGSRRAYDADGLDDLIIGDPDKYGWLRAYRDEKSVRGGVRVK